MEKNSWKIKSLGEVVEFLDGKRIPLKDSERATMKGDIPYYGANGQIDSINKFIFDEPLVLLAEDGGHFGSKTKPIAYKVEGKSWVNNHAHVLKPINGLNIDFLKWSLAFYDVSKFTTGSTRVKLTKGDALKMQIPVPDLKTQQKIASILEQADAARQKRKQANQLTEQFLQSAFLEMFGDPVRNEKGWGVSTLEQLCEVGSSRRVFVDELVDNGIPFFRGTEIAKLGEGVEIHPTLFIAREHYNQLKELTGIPRIGDLLMPSICPDGRIFRVVDNSPFYFKDGRVLWIKVNESNVNSVYLQQALRRIFNTNYHNIASGTTFAELKIVSLKKVEVPCPPLPLQQKFASIVEQVEQLRVKQRESEKELENLFGSLMQMYFG